MYAQFLPESSGLNSEFHRFPAGGILRVGSPEQQNRSAAFGKRTQNVRRQIRIGTP